MPNLNGEIKGFICGDDIDVFLDITDLPIGQTLVEAYLTVKAKTSDSDPGIFQKIITTISAPGSGHIEDDGALDGTARLRFELTAVNTTLLTPGTPYRYDIQVCTSAGKTYTPEVGIIRGDAGVTSTIC
jgi:hypothetical protein